jgi:hypothetical protein
VEVGCKFMIFGAPGATRVVLRELHEKRAKGVNNQFVPWDHSRPLGPQACLRNLYGTIVL